MWRMFPEELSCAISPKAAKAATWATQSTEMQWEEVNSVEQWGMQ